MPVGNSVLLFHARGANDCTDLDGGSEVHLHLSHLHPSCLPLSLSLYGGTWMERLTARVVVEATVGLGFEIDRMRISNVLRP
jgi:hypothetical protein